MLLISRSPPNQTRVFHLVSIGDYNVWNIKARGFGTEVSEYDCLTTHTYTPTQHALSRHVSNELFF